MQNLNNLSSIDFEELCLDLVLAETGIRLSAFGPGPDGGVDGRFSSEGESVILQCKHYIGSSFSDLKKSAKKELVNLKKLKPTRYMFFTSHSLTPHKSDAIADIFKEYLSKSDDVWGREDIENALQRNPEIVKSHFKLWLSSTSVLERILQSGLEEYTQTTKSELLDELKVYVRNPSFDDAYTKLEKERVLVVSGPPGVGKTTLAKMLAYNYLNEGWRFYAINSLEDGFAKVNDEKPTVFFFDDFLGRIKLDKQSLLQRDNSLALFVRRVRRSKNSRFILTTRAHIFEEARRLSDHVDDRKFQLSKYLLDVGTYTRKIKAYILFNHLTVSNLSKQHFTFLLKSDWLKKIIDHRNYNPRIIAMVSSESVESIEAPKFPQYLFSTLENPDLIWSKPFRNLEIKCQNLLITLYFCKEFGISINGLRSNFVGLHNVICRHYNHTIQPGDFEEALRILESGFISIAGDTVSFVNPSVRDFLKSYLIDKELLSLLSKSSTRSDFAKQVWQHIEDIFKSHEEDKKHLAFQFKKFAEQIEATPAWSRTTNNGYVSFSTDDLALSERVEMLFKWWEITKDERFLEKAFDLIELDSIKSIEWVDGALLPELHWWAYHYLDDDYSWRSKLLSSIEGKIVRLLEEGVDIQQLLVIVEHVEEYMSDLSSEHLGETLEQCVNYEFNETRDAIGFLDTESDLSEHLEALESIAKVTGNDIEQARTAILDRISELEEEEQTEQTSSYVPRNTSTPNSFSDDELKNLFSSLL